MVVPAEVPVEVPADVPSEVSAGVDGSPVNGVDGLPESGLRRGRQAAKPKATRAAPEPMAMTTRNAFSEGRATEPNVVVIWARVTPATALETDVPMDRMSVLRLLAAAVSETGTAPMTSEGIAP